MGKRSVFYRCIHKYLFPQERAASVSRKENTFFNNWFRENGQSYSFIFKKNLSITNVQFAELVILVRKHIAYKADYKKRQNKSLEIQFITVNEYVEKFELLQKTFFDKINRQDSVNEEAKLESFTDLYESLFESIVAIDTFYGSCNIYVPYNLQLDIESVCFYSGYIHSCGRNLFTRKLYKATYEEFKANIEKFLLLSEGAKKGIVPFTAYCHEDFTPFDRDEDNQFITNGLDDIKFYVEKTYMNDMPLSLVLQKLREDFSDRLNVSKSGDYHLNIQANTSSALFLISDRAINHANLSPARTKYYICYEQQYINENPYHLFNENKPAWIDHVTIPHTLMGALINIGMYSAKADEVKVLDPFVGSGTTNIELAKFPNALFEGYDLSPLTKCVTSDNIDFFSYSSTELKNVQHYLLTYKLYLLTSLEKLIAKELSQKKSGLAQTDTEKRRKVIREEKEKLIKTLEESEGGGNFRW